MSPSTRRTFCWLFAIGTAQLAFTGAPARCQSCSVPPIEVTIAPKRVVVHQETDNCCRGLLCRRCCHRRECCCLQRGQGGRPMTAATVLPLMLTPSQVAVAGHAPMPDTSLGTLRAAHEVEAALAAVQARMAAQQAEAAVLQRTFERMRESVDRAAAPPAPPAAAPAGPAGPAGARAPAGSVSRQEFDELKNEVRQLREQLERHIREKHVSAPTPRSP